MKSYLNAKTIKTILDAAYIKAGNKKVLFIDMDGVIADFMGYARNLSDEWGIPLQEFLDEQHYRHVPHFFGNLKPIKGAQEAIKILFDSGLYDIYLLSSPAWERPDSFSDKRHWVENYLDERLTDRLELSLRKGDHIGHILIDDRIKNGVDEFIGEHLWFGKPECPDWDKVLRILLPYDVNEEQPVDEDWRGIDKYFEDWEYWKQSFSCRECGNDDHTKFAYRATYSNGEEWVCKVCKSGGCMVSEQPREDNY